MSRLKITKGNIIYWVTIEQKKYSIERININIPLTLDTYRPPLHPFNFINLLCRTPTGYHFLQREKFIDHCLEIIEQPEAEDKAVKSIDQSKSLDHLKYDLF